MQRILSSCSARPATSDRGAADLKASPLPPAPLLTAAGWLAGRLALQYSDRLDGLLGFCCLILVLLNLSAEVCADSLVAGC